MKLATRLEILFERCSIHPDREATIGYSYQRQEIFFPPTDPVDDPDCMPSERCCGDCAYRRHGIICQPVSKRHN